MVRHPSSTLAPGTRGGSTRAANSRRTKTAAQLSAAEPGRPKDGWASGHERGDRAAPLGHVDRGGGTTFRPGGGRGVEVLIQHQEQPKFDNWRPHGKHGARGRRGFSTRRGRAGCPDAERRRGKWVRTGYGNWVRWSPPAPRAVQAPQGSAAVAGSLQGVHVKRAKRTEKALKLEKAHVQLKRKVKALEAKCVELQARAEAAEEMTRRKAPSSTSVGFTQARTPVAQVQTQAIAAVRHNQLRGRSKLRAFFKNSVHG